MAIGDELLLTLDITLDFLGEFLLELLELDKSLLVLCDSFFVLIDALKVVIPGNRWLLNPTDLAGYLLHDLGLVSPFRRIRAHTMSSVSFLPAHRLNRPGILLFQSNLVFFDLFTSLKDFFLGLLTCYILSPFMHQSTFMS